MSPTRGSDVSRAKMKVSKLSKRYYVDYDCALYKIYNLLTYLLTLLT